MTRAFLNLLCAFFKGLRIRPHCSERGVVATELTVASPLLVLIITGAIDFTTVIGQYSLLEEAVHDGIRYASTMSILEQGSYEGLATGSSCAPVGNSRLHTLLQDRVAELVRTSGKKIDLTSLCIRTNVTASIVEPARRVVEVEIMVNYRGIFPGTSTLQLRVQAMGPMLCTNCS